MVEVWIQARVEKRVWNVQSLTSCQVERRPFFPQNFDTVLVLTECLFGLGASELPWIYMYHQRSFPKNHPKFHRSSTDVKNTIEVFRARMYFCRKTSEMNYWGCKQNVRPVPRLTVTFPNLHRYHRKHMFIWFLSSKQVATGVVVSRFQQL